MFENCRSLMDFPTKISWQKQEKKEKENKRVYQGQVNINNSYHKATAMTLNYRFKTFTSIAEAHLIFQMLEYFI